MNKIKNYIFYFSIRAILFFVSSFSFVSHAAEDVVSSKKYVSTGQTGFLFEIEKDGRKSFIFGTIHTGFSPAQIIDARTSEIIKKSDRIYVEADIDDVQKSDQAIEKEGFYHGGKKLVQFIDNENYQLYRSILVDRGQFLSIQEYENAKPWLIAMLVPIADSLSESYPLLEFGSDIQVIKLAKRNKIPLIELEGITSQAKLFSAMADDMQRDYFADYVELVKKRIIYRRIADEIAAWTSLDFDDLEKIMNEARQKNDAYSSFYFKNIVDGRNKNFIKLIADASDITDGGFFAIGCEHLVGATGVVRGLRARGYSVKQIKYMPENMTER